MKASKGQKGKINVQASTVASVYVQAYTMRG